MIKFIKRLLGWECCSGGEWTQWITLQVNYIRPTSYERDGSIWIETKEIEFTKRWQERSCTLCGRMQQRNLKQ